MGLKALFSKEGRKERSLTKAIAKAGNSKLKPDDRRPALYNLLEDGSEAAIDGLLKRLTFIYTTNLVSDEEEKNYVYEGLLSLGDDVLVPLRRHLKQAPTLSWGLRILDEICDHEQTWEVLAEVLEDYEPGYERDPSRKQQLLTFLGDFDDERASRAIVPFLEDHDETVRYISIDALFKLGHEEIAREPLLQLLVSEEEDSRRLEQRIAEGFLEKGWVVKGYRGSVEKTLAGDYVVDGKGRLKRKKGRS